MKSKGKMILLAAVAALVLVPALCWGEVYVEGYVGGTFSDNADMSATTNHPIGTVRAYENHNIPGRIDPSVIGGVKFGTWFVKEGFLGYNYPDWMKYLGFYLDVSYHKHDFRHQRMDSTGVDRIPPIFGSAPIPDSVDNVFKSDGDVFTVAFMFAARYGFLPDSEVPFGRLQPYVGVGPAILIAHQEPQIRSARYLAEGPDFINPFTTGVGGDTDVTIALAVEGGVRWMALKNVSLDLSFKYRYASPSFNYDYVDPMYGNPVNFSLDPDFNLFSFQLGAAYHF
ncbi:MAG: outer membrane protein [Desulfobacteraceae bacterium]